MSYTATATRGLTPTNPNLSVFSHPPVKRDGIDKVGRDSRSMPAMPVIPPLKTALPAPEASDEEDLFNLDMVTMDMNFEQAYSMYTQLQQKNALLGVEQLQKAQQLNDEHAQIQTQTQTQSQTHSHAAFQNEAYPESQYLQAHMNNFLNASTIPSKEWVQTPRQYPGDVRTHDLELPPQLAYNLVEPARQQHTQEYKPRNSSLPGFSLGSLISPPGEMAEGLGEVHLSRQETDFLAATEKADEADQFFSVTESSALDKFLDNLAFSSEVNPYEFYHQSQPKVPHMFEMQTMGHAESLGLGLSLGLSEAAAVKRDIADAFQLAQTRDLKSFGDASAATVQLPTPDISISLGQGKRAYEREDSVELELMQSRKKRRNTKPLLTISQKRLNHSYLEQKRRLLCKDAYERCLRLVTNVEDYKNDLVSASLNAGSKKRSKRKQLTKDGLPNLSKHSALLKISNEIVKIQGKNEGLRRLLGEIQ